MMPHCGAKTRQGRPCRLVPMLGQVRCRMHGGGSPQARRAAEVRVTEARVAAVVGELVTTPCDDPLSALTELAGEVLAWRDVLRREISRLTDLATTDEFGVERAKAVVELYERAMDRASRLLVAIAKLDLDARFVKVTEAQGAIVAAALERALSRYGLYRDDVRVALADELRRVDPAAKPFGTGGGGGRLG